MKFGIVGVIAFIIDWGILNLLVGLFHMHNVLAATISFIISLIFNYVASMKVVFKHRDDMARWMEIVIFVVGAVIGLFMNDAIIWISTYGMNHDAYVSQSAEYLIRTNVGKLIATAVVMVWNFVTRKWLLDDTHTNATNRLKKNAEGTIGNAEEKAREIIDEALKTAENKKRESLLEVKEESIRTKNELDKEIKERRAEAQRYERRVQQKEENIDKKADAIEKREASLASRE